MVYHAKPNSSKFGAKTNEYCKDWKKHKLVGVSEWMIDVNNLQIFGIEKKAVRVRIT